jgi:choloylglycine hydrolase
MCTAISLKLNKHYFGRTLDLEYHYNESVIITPRNFTFHFRYNKPINNHYLIFGIGIIENNYPLYYDACNECGLSIAGLNLPHSTTYSSYVGSKVNITSFELIPYILSNCTNIKETIDILNNCNITNDDFNINLKSTKLHFLISDNNSSIVLEIIEKKIIIYDNPFNVLTNEPTFKFHIENINNYSHLFNNTKLNIISKSKGTNLINMPGDYSSVSRFIRMVYTKENIKLNENNIGELFNIFNNVFEINGISNTNNYKTLYLSLYNTNDLILYYKTYQDFKINKIDIKSLDINSNKLISFIFSWN